MRWIELATRVDGEAAEAVSEIFSRVAPGGVAIEADVIPLPDGDAISGPTVTVRAYLPLDGSVGAKTRSTEEALWYVNSIWPVGPLETREVLEEDWANAWRAHYPISRVGPFVIKPAWLDYVAGPTEHILELDPGMAFGTGQHPTTQSCLLGLLDVVQPGQVVLDVGTGSGILAIAAARLGAARVLAVDIDPIAVEAAAANVARNGLADRIQVASGSAGASTDQFDVVVANITVGVLEGLRDELLRRLKPNGILVTGGLIAERSGPFLASLRATGRLLDERLSGDWLSVVARPQ